MNNIEAEREAFESAIKEFLSTHDGKLDGYETMAGSWRFKDQEIEHYWQGWQLCRSFITSRVAEFWALDKK